VIAPSQPHALQHCACHLATQPQPSGATTNVSAVIPGVSAIQELVVGSSAGPAGLAGSMTGDDGKLSVHLAAQQQLRWSRRGDIENADRPMTGHCDGMGLAASVVNLQASDHIATPSVQKQLLVAKMAAD